MLRRAVARWLLVRNIRRELYRRGIRRKEASAMASLIGKLLLLDFPFLVGVRTKLGLIGLAIQPVLDVLGQDAMCASHPKICAVANAISGWLVIAGLRGAVAAPAPLKGGSK